MRATGGGTILLVCTANRCRSPLAEAVLGSRAAAAGLGWEVLSAGVRARPGDVTEPEVIRTLAEAGIAVTARPVRRLDERVLAQADLVLTAERGHRSRVLELAPELVGRAFTLLELERLLNSAPPRTARGPRTPAQVAAAADAARSLAGPGSASDDLADPIGRPMEAFRECRRVVERAVGRLVAAAAAR